jgi:predicted N-acetyltransferase YhbS
VAIIKADTTHIKDILAVTKAAFSVYNSKLLEQFPDASPASQAALDETEAQVLSDVLDNTVFVCEKNGKILGAVRLKKMSDELLYLYRFAVKPKRQNGGVGSELITAAIAYAKQNGFKAIYLYSNTKNIELGRFYYGKGFYIHSTNFDLRYIRGLYIYEVEPNAKLDLKEKLKI